MTAQPPASDKQLKFMASLGIQAFNGISMQAAKEMIAAKLAEGEVENPQAQPQAAVPIVRPGEPAKPEKEYHLTIEACRLGALECALKHNMDITDATAFWAIVEQYFNWIHQGSLVM